MTQLQDRLLAVYYAEIEQAFHEDGTIDIPLLESIAKRYAARLRSAHEAEDGLELDEALYLDGDPVVCGGCGWAHGEHASDCRLHGNDGGQADG